MQSWHVYILLLFLQNVRVTNIQTLEAVYRDHPGNVRNNAFFLQHTTLTLTHLQFMIRIE